MLQCTLCITTTTISTTHVATRPRTMYTCQLGLQKSLRIASGTALSMLLNGLSLYYVANTLAVVLSTIRCALIIH